MEAVLVYLHNQHWDKAPHRNFVSLVSIFSENLQLFLLGVGNYKKEAMHSFTVKTKAIGIVYSHVQTPHQEFDNATLTKKGQYKQRK